MTVRFDHQIWPSDLTKSDLTIGVAREHAGEVLRMARQYRIGTAFVASDDRRVRACACVRACVRACVCLCVGARARG